MPNLKLRQSNIGALSVWWCTCYHLFKTTCSEWLLGLLSKWAVSSSNKLLDSDEVSTTTIAHQSWQSSESCCGCLSVWQSLWLCPQESSPTGAALSGVSTPLTGLHCSGPSTSNAKITPPVPTQQKDLLVVQSSGSGVGSEHSNSFVPSLVPHMHWHSGIHYLSLLLSDPLPLQKTLGTTLPSSFCRDMWVVWSTVPSTSAVQCSLQTTLPRISCICITISILSLQTLQPCGGAEGAG